MKILSIEDCEPIVKERARLRGHDEEDAMESFKKAAGKVKASMEIGEERIIHKDPQNRRVLMAKKVEGDELKIWLALTD